MLAICAGLCLLLALMVPGCVSGDEETGSVQGADEMIQVAVTIPPFVEFVERVGGEHVEVMTLVPRGADPHTFEPTPAQLSGIAQADMYVMVGSGIEFERAWMDKLAAINPRMHILNASEGIDPIRVGKNDHTAPPNGETVIDPHVWLSLRNAAVMVEHICEGLTTLDPDREAEYCANKEQYKQELQDLDAEISSLLKGKSPRIFLVVHPSWGYLARDYNLEQVAILQDGKEPTPQGIANLVTIAKKNGIKVIFASPEFSTRSADVIAEEIEGRVVLISPLEESYLENMRGVADALAQG